MTQTFGTAALYFGTSFYSPGMMPSGANAGGTCVWNFEFGSLEFVWSLVLGIWKLLNPVNLIQSYIACNGLFK
jgi:hypothetical protein